MQQQITIGLNTWRHGPWAPDDILYEIVCAGWSTYAGHLSIGNADLNNWVYNAEDFETILSVFKNKYAKKEVNGVKLSWTENSAGANFLFWPECSYKEITIEITKNPQMLRVDENYEIIDIQWYINTLFPALNKNFGVSVVECICTDIFQIP